MPQLMRVREIWQSRDWKRTTQQKGQQSEITPSVIPATRDDGISQWRVRIRISGSWLECYRCMDIQLLKPAEQVWLACRVMPYNVPFSTACPDDLRVFLFVNVKSEKSGISHIRWQEVSRHSLNHCGLTCGHWLRASTKECRGEAG